VIVGDRAGAESPDESKGLARLLSILIVTRGGCTVLVFYTIVHELRLLAACLFTLACLTDLLDGQIAKRTGVSPSLGPYGDATADFLLVLGAFAAFVVRGLFPLWTLVIVVLMFVQFVVTSEPQGPLYDPVGKYYGAALFGAVGITLVLDNPVVRHAVLIAVVLSTAASAASRALLLFRLRRGDTRRE
jgi:phosphatidylglycerophosphate synthase